MAVAVEVAVSLNAARVFLGACEAGFPASVAVAQRSAIALGEVKAVIVAVHGEQVSNVYRTTEELYCVISTLGDVDVLNPCSVAHAVQRKSVVFDVGT